MELKIIPSRFALLHLPTTFRIILIAMMQTMPFIPELQISAIALMIIAMGVTDENAISATVSPNGIIMHGKGTPLTLTANSGGGINYQWVKGTVILRGLQIKLFACKNGCLQSERNKLVQLCFYSSAASVTIVITTLQLCCTRHLNSCSTGSVVLQANSGLGYMYHG